HVVPPAGGIHIPVGLEREFLKQPDQGRRAGL
ncbi:MAG: hypothetical protein K0Q84_2790, partial [Arthrobacter sp.]|nr:hypothetical protein [Arthrobacter sp.]